MADEPRTPEEEDEQLARALAASLGQLDLGTDEPDTETGGSEAVTDHGSAQDPSRSGKGKALTDHGSAEVPGCSGDGKRRGSGSGDSSKSSAALGGAAMVAARGASAQASREKPLKDPSPAASEEETTPQAPLSVHGPGKPWPQGPEAGDGTRSYAVWSTPGSTRDLVGVHIGRGAWYGIASCLQGGRYLSGSDHLRGAWGLTAAIRECQQDYRRHGVPREPRIFLW